MIVIADPSAERRGKLADAVAPAGDHLEVSRVDDITDELAPVGGTGRVVVLGPGLELSDALAYAEKTEQQDGRRTATLLVLEELDAPRLREALRSGVDDVLTVTATDDEWREAIGRARARVAWGQAPGRDPGGAPRGTVVSVFSTKGGCGTSLIASNLAVMVGAREGHRVALVDLDLQSGDLAVMLQLVPALSIYDASQSAGRLDADELEGYLTPHPSGASLLAAPLEPSLADQVTPGAVVRILDLMRRAFSLTIVDTPALFTEQVLAALDASDHIVLVGSMDVPSIKNLRSAMTTLNQLGHPRDHLSIVLNRADSKVGLRVSEVERSLGATVDVRLPSNRDVPLSINQGTPLASTRRRSAVVNAIGELADRVVPEDQSEPAGRRRRGR